MRWLIDSIVGWLTPVVIWFPLLWIFEPKTVVELLWIGATTILLSFLVLYFVAIALLWREGWRPPSHRIEIPNALALSCGGRP